MRATRAADVSWRVTAALKAARRCRGVNGGSGTGESSGVSGWRGTPEWRSEGNPTVEAQQRKVCKTHGVVVQRNVGRHIYPHADLSCVPRANVNRLVLGRTLRAIREEKGLTQERVGYLAHLHRNYISDTELGKRNISWDALSQWVAALDVDWVTFGTVLERTASSRRRSLFDSRKD
jgi:DNA-binding XRE family transcriptional regulator